LETQPLETQPLETQPLETQPLETQQMLETLQPSTRLNEKIINDQIESIVQAPNDAPESMPFVLPFDTGRILGN
jgi:hypothetical protein